MLGRTRLIFVDPGVKINGAYYRDVLLTQEMLPHAWNFRRLLHFSAGQWTVAQSLWDGRVTAARGSFRLSLLLICGIPTVPTSTLWTTRCGVRCRTVFIRRRCDALTIWRSVWLTCGSVWSKALLTNDDAIDQWRSRLRACVRANGGHYLNIICRLTCNCKNR